MGISHTHGLQHSAVPLGPGGAGGEKRRGEPPHLPLTSFSPLPPPPTRVGRGNPPQFGSKVCGSGLRDCWLSPSLRTHLPLQRNKERDWGRDRPCELMLFYISKNLTAAFPLTIPYPPGSTWGFPRTVYIPPRGHIKNTPVSPTTPHPGSQDYKPNNWVRTWYPNLSPPLRGTPTSLGSI